MTPQTETALIEVVRDVARAEILPRFRRLDSADIGTKSGPDDLVTVADRAAEAAIAARIPDILPGAEVVGEEGVDDDPTRLDRIAEADVCVIVDPIDGTANFAAGLATFGVILAVTRRGRTVFGLLYDPVMDDWVWAREGGGAHFSRDGRALRARAEREAAAAHIYATLRLWPKEVRAPIAAALTDFGMATTIRCSCHEYRQLALGHVDGIATAKLMPWDHAAGVLIAQEAGAVARVAGRAPYAPTLHDGTMVVATGQRLRDAIENGISAR